MTLNKEYPMSIDTANVHSMCKGNPDPEVGMGATQIMWSDRHPFTVVEVSPNSRRCVVQEDRAVRTDKHGMSDCQDYDYEANPEGRKVTLSRRKNGDWRQVGDTQLFHLGYRSRYFDYSF